MHSVSRCLIKQLLRKKRKVLRVVGLAVPWEERTPSDLKLWWKRCKIQRLRSTSKTQASCRRLICACKTRKCSWWWCSKIKELQKFSRKWRDWTCKCLEVALAVPEDQWVVQHLQDRKQNSQKLRKSSRQNKQRERNWKRNKKQKKKQRKRLQKKLSYQRDSKRPKLRRMKEMPSTRKRISQKQSSFTLKQLRCVQQRSFSTVT